MTFAVRLKEQRERAGLTQQELADRAGMHRMGLVKLELGEREPAWATVQALCRALGVDCAVFMEDTRAESGRSESAQKTSKGRKKKT
jgi:transcriptional regulator with XRE-family HTH domain